MLEAVAAVQTVSLVDDVGTLSSHVHHMLRTDVLAGTTADTGVTIHTKALLVHDARPERQALARDGLACQVEPLELASCRVSLSVGLVSQALALVVGASSGYLGGRVDAVASFVIQVFSSFPFLLFALVVMYVLGPGLQNLYVALGLLMWTGTARLVRGEVMRLKSSEYVLACVVAGGSPWRVIVRHLLPNCLPLLVITATLGIPNAILCEATLSFLGLGVQPPMASWGQMIAAAQPFVQSSTYYSLALGIAIFITVIAFNLLGDAVNDAIDPRGRVRS